MVDKVFLLWHSYVTDEMLLIGSLRKINNKYIFKYEKDAVTAMNMRCFLPFPYTEKEIDFDILPSFFAQRMLTSKYNMNKFGIKYDPKNELALLAFGDSIRNSDNFRIVTSESYNLICDNESKKKSQCKL